MEENNKYYDLLNSAVNDVGLDFDENKYNQFIKYMNLLKSWNEKVNLTAITDDLEIVNKHFVDSIKIFKFQPLKDAKKVIDVGTGGGFPGIPMKIVKPELEIVLLDSLKKRISVLESILNDIKINDVTTIHGRAEEFGVKPEFREKFDVVVSRAVANLAVLSEFCLPYAKVGGYFVALKGPSVDGEVNESKRAINELGGKLIDLIEVNIENTDLKHNLVVIKKIKNTPKQYPRKAGIVSKKPLL